MIDLLDLFPRKPSQGHCFICDKSLGRVKYECPTCGEWLCSKRCLSEHLKAMDGISRLLDGINV